MASASYLKMYRTLVKEVNGWLNCSDETDIGNQLRNDDLMGNSSSSSISQAELHETEPGESEVEEENCYDALMETGEGGEPVYDSDVPPVSSDDDAYESDDLQTATSFQDDIAEWVVDANISRDSCNKLLSVLRKHGLHFPKDSRKLLKTPQTVNVSAKCGGQYIHFGLRKHLHDVACNNVCCTNLSVQINVDGAQLYKSSNLQLWPILCTVNKSQPFIVTLYLGKAKPNSLDDFMNEFMIELTELQKHGFVCSECQTGIKFKVTLHSVVCDAPARAFVKNIKGHNSLHGCERCLAVGVSVSSRTVFTSATCFSSEKRTNEKFNKGDYIGTHQLGLTPLQSLTSSCINICSLDYMHLICLGVVRRMLHYWKSGDRSVKLGSLQLLQISERLVALRDYIPSEFARRPRTLLEMDRWKATEYRQFLLYTGPVVLKSVLSHELYEHFLCLSTAVNILLIPNRARRRYLLDYASNLLKYFVSHCERLYGETFVVYNVHSLMHVADDAIYFDSSLDDISAFRYENYLQVLKRLIRGTSNPLVQVAKRLQEYEAVCRVPFAVNSAKQQRQVSCHSRDSIVFLKSRQYAKVVECKHDKYLCEVYRKQSLRPFYMKPCSSDLVDIYYVSSHGRNTLLKVICKKDIGSKGLHFPCGDGYVLMPLIHREK